MHINARWIPPQPVLNRLKTGFIHIKYFSFVGLNNELRPVLTGLKTVLTGYYHTGKRNKTGF